MSEAEIFPGAVQRGDATLRRIDPSLTMGARQMGLAIAWAESRLGLSAPFAPGGVPSNNWGAVVYTGPKQAPPFGSSPGFITAGDHDAMGNPTSVKFAAFETMEGGARNFLNVWLRHEDTRAAANAGNAHAVAAAMYKYHYYTGTCPPSCTDAERINAYTNFIMGQAPRVAAALGQPLAVGRGAVAQPRSSSGGSSGGIIVPLLGAAATAFLVRKFFL